MLVLTLLLWPLNSGYAELLNAAIEEHSDSLSAAPAPLRAGVVFNETSLPATGTAGIWYLIPAWLPGLWHREVETATDPPQQRRSITARIDEPWGFQTDRQGGCWNYHYEPYSERQDGGNFISYKTVLQKQVLQVAPSVFVIRYRAICTTVSKPDNVIRQVYQQEEIQKITSVEPGLTRHNSSVRWFDANGRPTGGIESYSFMNLIRPYQRVDFAGGVNLRQDFKAYLASHGLQNLIPDDPAPAAVPVSK